MTTKEAEKLEPFKPPFSCHDLPGTITPSGYPAQVVLDSANTRVSWHLQPHEAQWLAARLNAPSPTPEAEKLADAIQPDAAIAWLWQVALFFEERGDGGEDMVAQANAANARNARRIADLIAASDYIRQTLKVKP